MIRNTLFVFCLALCLCVFSASSFAQNEMQQDRVAFSIGGYDILDEDDVATDFRAEWRFAHKVFNLFHPFVGLEGTSDGGLFALAGLLWDYKFYDRWFITPGIGVGVYKDGDGLDLGHTIQFRSQFEAGYEFENGHRISAAYSHISNGGLGDHNPGTEIIGLYYSIPINWFK